MSVKEVTAIVRKARKKGYKIEDRGTHFRIVARSGEFTSIHKTVEGSVSIHKATANVKKFMWQHGDQKGTEERRRLAAENLSRIQGGECVECGSLPDEEHKSGCQKGAVSMAAPAASPVMTTFTTNCDVCGEELKGGPTRQHLNLEKARHMRKAHPKPASEEASTCGECGFVAKSPAGLAIHKGRAHKSSGQIDSRALPSTPARKTSEAPSDDVTLEGAAREAMRSLRVSVEGLNAALEAMMKDLANEKRRNQSLQGILEKGLNAL